MSRTYGRTAAEIRASSIAKALVSALVRVEQFQDDAEMIFDDALLYSDESSNELSLCKLSCAQHTEVNNAIRMLARFFNGAEAVAQ